MKYLITGSSGLVGSALVSSLRQEKHEVVRLVRRAGKHPEPELVWEPEHGSLNPDDLESFDVVVNLAGENISEGRWNAEKKRRIYDSRVKGTTLLCETLARLKTPPRVLVSASAMGYYGDRGKQVLDEESSMGTGFLAEVCRDWEAATLPAVDKGIRVVNLRIGLVLTPEGGALKTMLTPFKLGLGGVVGSGEQYMSWITRDDLVRAIQFCVQHTSLNGPVNGLGPQPVTNIAFTRALGKALHRPTVMPLPAFMVKTLMGEMGEALLLGSTRVLPQRLLDEGFEFDQPELNGALSTLLA
jgi:hypothetical protein